MKPFLAATLGILMLVLAAIAMIGGTWISYSNDEKMLRNQLVAQQKSNEAVFDQTWKIIQQQAGVADQYKQAFREIYPDLMANRYGNARGGALMSWITEHNPQFDTSLYLKVANSIEVQRANFTREQQKLVDVKREHDNLLDTFPGSLFLSGRPKFDAKIVTSAKTAQAFAAGQENDVDLFPKTTTAAK